MMPFTVQLPRWGSLLRTAPGVIGSRERRLEGVVSRPAEPAAGGAAGTAPHRRRPVVTGCSLRVR
ncbi:hypothetical protein MO973_37210 [Paenibacillus sp. TRM 82003]|nr:hypothetical protein [Paenibacillus sp. TRM 82003]